MDPQVAKKILQDKYIGKKARIITKNNRIFEGKIMCVDYKGNIILHDSVAEILDKHNCPLNF